MRERLYLLKGKNVAIVAQDDYFGDAQAFVTSRQPRFNYLDLIGEHGKKYDITEVKKSMSQPSLAIGYKNFFTIIHSDGRYLGDISIFKLKSSYLFNLVILEPNKGFGTEVVNLITEYAFNSLFLINISVKIYQNNPEAFRFFIKRGFKYASTYDDNYVVYGVNYVADFLYLENPKLS